MREEANQVRGHVLDLSRVEVDRSSAVDVGRSFALSVCGSVQIDIPCLPPSLEAVVMARVEPIPQKQEL